MAFPAPRRAGEREREREIRPGGIRTAAGLQLQLCNKGMDLCSWLFLPAPGYQACLPIDPLVATRQDYNSKKTTGRGRLHSYIQGATTRGPFLVVLFFLPPSCSLAYQSLGSVQGNACELSFLNDVPAPADKPCYRGLGTEQQQSDTLRFCFCQVKNEKTTNLCQRIVKNLPEFPYKTRSKHGPIPETRGLCGV